MNTSKMPEDLTGRIQIRILSLWIRPKEKIALKFGTNNKHLTYQETLKGCPQNEYTLGKQCTVKPLGTKPYAQKPIGTRHIGTKPIDYKTY